MLIQKNNQFTKFEEVGIFEQAKVIVQDYFIIRQKMVTSYAEALGSKVNLTGNERPLIMADALSILAQKAIFLNQFLDIRDTGHLEELYLDIMQSNPYAKDILRDVYIELVLGLGDNGIKRLINEIGRLIANISITPVVREYNTYPDIDEVMYQRLLEENFWLLSLFVLRFTDISDDSVRKSKHATVNPD